MAVTIVDGASSQVPGGGVFGNLKYKVVDVTFDASYAASGEPFTAANIGLQTIIGCIQMGSPTQNANSGYLILFDYTNSVLRAYRQTAASSALIEVPGTTDLSATPLVVRLLVLGK